MIHEAGLLLKNDWRSFLQLSCWCYGSFVVNWQDVKMRDVFELPATLKCSRSDRPIVRGWFFASEKNFECLILRQCGRKRKWASGYLFNVSDCKNHLKIIWTDFQGKNNCIYPTRLNINQRHLKRYFVINGSVNIREYKLTDMPDDEFQSVGNNALRNKKREHSFHSTQY